jgi:hypothetical protein
LRLQKRQVLVAVGLQVAGIERCVGLDVVLELDDLQLETFALGDSLRDLRMRAGGDADGGGSRPAPARCRQRPPKRQ